MSEVVLLQRVLPHYRTAFMDRLAARLMPFGHRLRLVFGQEFPGEVPVSVAFERPWAVRIRNRYLTTGAGWLAWQPAVPHLSGADLVIMEQANRLLLNFALQARLVGDGSRLAYWGHGRNRQAAARNSTAERLKRRLRTNVDWWFAYTEGVAREIEASGFPRNRITAVENAIDDEQFRAAAAPFLHDPSRLDPYRRRLGSNRIALYCGGLYADKRLDFLIDAADRVRAAVPGLQLVVIGDGPARTQVEAAAAQRPWIHVLGHLSGADRVPWFLVSRVQLMPGLVGLGVLDSFLARTPLVTTRIPIHSPEIDYVQNRVNGVVTEDSLDEYACEVVRILVDDAWHARLREGCAASAGRYSLENMVDRFTSGVVACLAQPRALSA